MDEPGEWASQTLGATPALRGRPGGPGFEPGPAGAAAGRSPWDRSQRLWSESGIQWDAPSTGEPPVPVAEPPQKKTVKVTRDGPSLIAQEQ